MSTHNLCFEQKYGKYQIFSSENFPFLVVKFSIYLKFRNEAVNKPQSTEMQSARLPLPQQCDYTAR